MNKEKEYTVVWHIDVEASSAVDAVLFVAKEYFQERIARGIPDTACVFKVSDGDGESESEVTVDMAKLVLELPPPELAKIFGWEHPVQGRSVWRDEVQSGNTLLGYWEWVSHQLKEAV